MAKNAVTMGHAYVVIGAKVDATVGASLRAIQGSLRNVGATLQKAGAAVGGIGASIVGPLVAASQQAAQAIDNIAKASRRAGVSTEFMSEMGYVAGLAGSSMAELEKAVFQMSRAMDMAGRGSKLPLEALKAIGLRFEDLRGLGVEEQFLRIADALDKVRDQSVKAGAAQALLGRAGKGLIPLMTGGRESIKGGRQEARRLGVSITAADAKVAEDYADMQSRVGEALRGLGITISRVVLPSMQRAALYMTNLIANAREYLDQNPQLISYAYEFGRALVVAGAAIVTVGTSMRGLSVLFSPGGVFFVAAATVLYLTGSLDDLIDGWKDTVLAFEVGGRSLGSWMSAIAQAWQATLPVFSVIAEEIVAVFKGAWDGLKSGATSIGVDFGNSIAQGVFASVERMAINLNEMMYWVRIDLFKKTGLDKLYGQDEIKNREAERDQNVASIQEFFRGQRNKASSFYGSVDTGDAGGAGMRAPDLARIEAAGTKARDDQAGARGADRAGHREHSRGRSRRARRKVARGDSEWARPGVW
jgi:hypothetical protein